MKDNGDPRLVTPSVAARMLGVSRQRIRQMAEDGSLEARPTGRNLYVTRHSVQRELAVRAAERPMMTASDVASYFGTTRAQVYRWAASEKLRSHRSRKRTLFAPSDVASFVPPPPGRWPDHERNTP